MGSRPCVDVLILNSIISCTGYWPQLQLLRVGCAASHAMSHVTHEVIHSSLGVRSEGLNLCVSMFCDKTMQQCHTTLFFDRENFKFNGSNAILPVERPVSRL